MIIDFHTHAFPDAIAEKTVDFLRKKSKTVPFSDGKYSSLSDKTAAAGIDLAVVLPVVTNPSSASKINAFAAEIDEKTTYSRLFSFGGIHPDCDNYKEILNDIARLSLKGVKIHPAYQGVKLNDIRYKRIIGYAEELGLITITHGGRDIGIDGDFASPEMAEDVLNDVRPEKFVLAHMGGWAQWKEVENRLIGRRVYLDTAFCLDDFAYEAFATERQETLSVEDFTRMVKRHGSDKILFGTDSPWSDQQTQLDFIRSMPFTASEKEQILGLNAAKLLNI